MLHGFSIFRFELQAFVRILQAYIVHHGLHGADAELGPRLAKGAFTDLDDLRASHTQTLQAILERCALGGQGAVGRHRDGSDGSLETEGGRARAIGPIANGL